MKRLYRNTVMSLGVLLVAAVFFTATPGDARAGTDPYIGDIVAVAYTYCPRDWVEANGQILLIRDYQALYAIYGATYGGDGRTNFRLPDLRSRSARHIGLGACATASI